MTTPRLLEFGAFRLDLDAELLTKDGERVHLAPKSLALLSYLVEHPERLVTREELRRHLWGDAAVDHEQGIGFLVRQVRQALGDEAAEPRFIETVPRRGFRFLAPVSAVTTESSTTSPVWMWTIGIVVLAVVVALGRALIMPNDPEPFPVAVSLAVDETDPDAAAVARLSLALEQRLKERTEVRLIKGDDAESEAAGVVAFSIEQASDSLNVIAEFSVGDARIWRGVFSGPAGRLRGMEGTIAEDIANVVASYRGGARDGEGQVSEVEKSVE